VAKKDYESQFDDLIKKTGQEANDESKKRIEKAE
jgi:hypothetical protein